MSEFKNIPKNYSKAIINFIKKNRELARRVLAKIGEDYDEFMAAPDSLGGHVCTVR
jgi:serine/threonine protein kinase